MRKKNRARYGPSFQFDFKEGEIVNMSSSGSVFPAGAYRIKGFCNHFVRLQSAGNEIYTLEIPLLGKCKKITEKKASKKFVTQKEIEQHIDQWTKDYLNKEG